MTRFVVVLSVLVLLAVVFFLAARLISVVERTAIQEAREAAAQARVEDRIRPIGRVVTAAAEEEAEPARRSAADIYQGICAACHDTGAADAPRKGDEAIWAERLGQGLDTVVRHAIEGIGAMPARGGDPRLSDDEVRAAVVYLLEQSGQSVDGEAEEAVAEAPAPEAAPETVAEADAGGDVAAGQRKYATCIGCHGAQGQGMGIFPKLAGHTAEEIVDLLKKYRAGEQVGPNTALMAPNARNLSDEDIADLAAFIESL
jgi:cytochrome c5